jgi:predicted nucleotidyltransferase
METDSNDLWKKLGGLREREKELHCLYRIDSVLLKADSPEDAMMNMVKVIADGWQFPALCSVSVEWDGRVWKSANFNPGKYRQERPIRKNGKEAGHITIYYSNDISASADPFLPEEELLLNAIVTRIEFFLHRFSNYNQKRNDQGDHWKWLFGRAEDFATAIPLEDFGIHSVWLIGSVKSGMAGPCSDIDLVIHYDGNESNAEKIHIFTNGFASAVRVWRFNKDRTGNTRSMIDVHLVTDQDIMNKTSFGIMITKGSGEARLLVKRKD